MFFPSPFSIASRTPAFLIEILHALAHRVMNHVAHIRLIDAHAERYGRHHRMDLAAQPVGQDFVPALGHHARVVRTGLNAALRQLLGQILGVVDRERVDDARSVAEAFERQVGEQLVDLFFFGGLLEELGVEMRVEIW